MATSVVSRAEWANIDYMPLSRRLTPIAEQSYFVAVYYKTTVSSETSSHLLLAAFYRCTVSRQRVSSTLEMLLSEAIGKTTRASCRLLARYIAHPMFAYSGTHIVSH